MDRRSAPSAAMRHGFGPPCIVICSFLAGGCAAPVLPSTTPPLATSPRAPSQVPSSSSSHPLAEPPPALPDSGTAAAAAATPAPPLTSPAGADLPRLDWVNPARCLPSCSFHPGPALVRVNDHGQADPRGRHRVDGAALPSLRKLLSQAEAAGHPIRMTSAFRSYAEQARVFRTTKERGRAARPGHSEHQLGTAIDLRLPSGAAILWLATHAREQGFVLSYPAAKQRLTGYRPEPWHVRFVGVEIADELHRQGGTLEELFRRRPELGRSGSCADCPAAISQSPCGEITEGGTCEGTVLTWCYQGRALAMVDCAAFGQSCGRAAGEAVPDCGAFGASVGRADAGGEASPRQERGVQDEGIGTDDDRL